MSDVVCRTCGQKNCRVDAPLKVNESTVEDSYCGVCGANWGVFVKRIVETRSGKARMPKRRDRVDRSL